MSLKAEDTLYVAGSKIMSDVIGCRKASFSNKQNCELFLTEEVYELDELYHY